MDKQTYYESLGTALVDNRQGSMTVQVEQFGNYSGRRARKNRWLNVQCMDGGEKL
jgi:hypothetical protein